MKVDEDEGIVAFETKEVFSAALIKETLVLSGNCLKMCLAQFFAGRSALLMLNFYASATVRWPLLLQQTVQRFGGLSSFHRN